MTGRVAQEEFWAKVPHWVVLHPELDAFAIRVYCVLSKHANNVTRRAFPGIRTLAMEGRMSPNTVQRSLADLERVGALEITKEKKGERREVNHYFLPMVRVSPHDTPTDFVYHAVNQGVSPDDTRRVSPGDTELDPSELEEITRTNSSLENPKPRLAGESRAAYVRRLAGEP